MRPYNLQSLVRIRIPAPDGGEPRQSLRLPHPPSVVAQAKVLVETTRLTLKTIARRVNVNSGTLSRWVQKHGWTRPPGSWPLRPRPERRYVPVMIGRVQAARLRAQAERLLRDVESAPEVDPARLAEALDLLARARAEQANRRTRLREPPPPPSPEEAAERDRQKRAEAAHKGWKRRYAKRYARRAWMYEEIDK